jgi:flagellar protein FlgJ
MNIQANHPAVQASQLPLESLAGNPNISETDKIAEASRQFEALLLRQILQEARKNSSGSSTGSLSSDIYSDMINQQIADSVSRSGAFGLGKSLQGQLSEQVLPKKHDATSGHAPTIISHDRKH